MKYKNEEEVIKAFQASTFRDPKLTFGDALIILVEEFGLTEEDASFGLAPMMDGTENLPIWEIPGSEEE